MADAPDHVIWDGVLAHLRSSSPTLCRQWFDEIEPMGINNGVLWLRSGTEMQQRYLRTECLDSFRDAAQSATGRLLAVEFLGPGDVPPSAQHNGLDHQKAQPRRMVRHDVGDDELVLHPDLGFDTFIVGPSNRLSYAAARAVADSPGAIYNPLFIHGGVGLGKTHLLQAICHRFLEEGPDLRILYLSCEAFISRFMDAVQSGTINEFRRQFRDVGMLVIDDVHFLCKMDSSQEEFFHTFNTLYQSNRQIVLSSDAAPDEIPDLEQRLVSRFNWGLVTQIAPPEYETRVQIVLNKAKHRGFNVPEDVAALIAARFDANIRELEGALLRVQVHSHVNGEPITLDLAKDALGVAIAAAKPRIGVQVIIERVADFFGVPVPQLLSRKRTRSVALPRHVGMYLARQHTMHSLEEIGGYFGGRDHTTVMHGVNVVKNLRDKDEDLDAAVREIERSLHSIDD